MLMAATEAPGSGSVLGLLLVIVVVLWLVGGLGGVNL